jgi:hypothetical protein
MFNKKDFGDKKNMKAPNSRSVVSYAYKVLCQGKKIGILQGFSPSANRPLERVRELGNTIDDTIEIVPGRTDLTVTLERFEIYDSNILQATLSPDVNPAGDITTILMDPIQIVETITNPAGTQTRNITYADCWISTWSKAIREGTILVMETVNLGVTKVIIG